MKMSGDGMSSDGGGIFDKNEKEERADTLVIVAASVAWSIYIHHL